MLPTRPRRPRDKAKLVGGIDCRALAFGPPSPPRVLQPGRSQRCHQGLARRPERSPDIAPGRTRARHKLFEEIERAALRPLPSRALRLAEWRSRRAGLVPMSRSNATITRCRIALRASRSKHASRPTPSSCSTKAGGSPAHLRSSGNGRHTTVARIHLLVLIGALPTGRSSGSGARHPQSVLTLRCCAKKFSPSEQHPSKTAPVWALSVWSRASAASVSTLPCGRALEIGARTYGSVRSILDNRLDQEAGEAAGATRSHRSSQYPRLSLYH